MSAALLAWSGGKDSAMALAQLRANEAARVVGLMTTVSASFERVSIHGVRRSLLQAQAAALELPLFEVPLPADANNEQYESAWAAGLARARAALGPIEQLAFGDLFLPDVRAFREQQAARLAYQPMFPLWGRDTSSLARQFIAAGYEAYLVCVDTTQLAADFAGRRFDATLLRDLPATVDPCGENGEFHTCVVAGPIFREPISVLGGERTHRDSRFEFYDLQLASERRLS